MMEDWAGKVLGFYGPAFLGWVGLVFCAWRLVVLTVAFTHLIDRNTEALTRFATLLDERIPKDPH